MNREQFVAAINWLRRQDPPLVLPFNIMPGEKPGGNALTFTRTTWKRYAWNPPGTLPFDDDAWDDAASPKPTWTMLQQALTPAELARAQGAALKELDNICMRKIIVQYGASSLEQEILLRLRNGQTPEQDAERDRLRGVCQRHESAIRAATTTAAVIRLQTAAKRDSFWAPPAD